MSLPVDKLRKDSSKAKVSNAISESISRLRKEGYDRSQAIAIAHQIAKKRTRK